MKKAILILLPLFLISCASKLPQPQPRPKNPEALVKANMEMVLKDPGSAQYEFSPPFLAKTGRGNQWVMKFFVNSKNSFGGYTGFQMWVAAFMNGTSVDYMMSEAENPFLDLIKPVDQTTPPTQRGR